MASLQARHQRICAIVTARTPSSGERPGQWTTFAEATKAKGCTCVPLYYVVDRHGGKLIRQAVGANRKEAERALDAHRGDVARRTYKVFRDVRFDEWGDQWLANLTAKPSTARVYGHSIAYAKQTFGAVKVRDLTTADVRQFLETIRRAYLERHPVEEGEPQRQVSPATLAKHLRALGACLQAASAEGYASENVVRGLHKTSRPKVTKSRPSYFADDELARLWPELAYRPLMLALLKTAVGTGARFGELAALDWDHVDLLAGDLHIACSFSEGFGVTAPKSGEARTVDLVPATAKVLEDWYTQSGGEGLVFAREEDGGYLTSSYVLRRVLIPALKRAGVPRVGERGGVRDFHSLRHTFARIALEGGAPIDWVHRQLGHSSIMLTVDTYGDWSRSAQKAEAKRLSKAFKL